MSESLITGIHIEVYDDAVVFTGKSLTWEFSDNDLRIRAGEEAPPLSEGQLAIRLGGDS